MSARLAWALVERIRRLPPGGKFVLVEGVSEDVAADMAAAWTGDGIPVLAVASRTPARFGDAALKNASATGLRNRQEGGFCLVVCQGTRLVDEGSLGSVENVAPSDLLRDTEGLALIAQAPPAAPLDGPARDVRKAIEQLPAAERPPAIAVARFFDRVAAQENPLAALPELGAFRDDPQGERADAARIRENLRLAATRRSDELLRPAILADARQRARRVLRRRPGISSADAEATAERLMANLQAGNDDPLVDVAFDEAREILARRQQPLASEVREALDDYRLVRPERRADANDSDVNWDHYRGLALALARPEDRRAAALELIAFDDIENRAVFAPGLRRKLERLLRDRIIRASRPSSPELGLLKAALSLDDGLGAIQLASPAPLAEDADPNAANAGRALALSCCRLRLGQLLSELEDDYGIEVDAQLRQPADPPWPEVFEDAELDRRRLEPVQLRLLGNAGDSLVLEWRPDLDDLAMLRSALLFAEEQALLLESPGSPSLAAFCAGPAPAPSLHTDAARPIAAGLQASARDVLARGLDPDRLGRWADAWRQAAAADEAAESLERAGDLALAGALRTPAGIALTPLAPLKAEWLGQHLDAMWSLLFLALNRGDEATGEPLEATADGTARGTAAHYPPFLRTLGRDAPLLPSAESRIWSVYGGDHPDTGGHAASAIAGVLGRLLQLQPEVAGDLRCLAWGPGAGDLLAAEAVDLLAQNRAAKVELYCVEEAEGSRPSASTLARADDELSGEGRDRLKLRYLPTLAAARKALQPTARGSAPAVHLALVCGLTAGGRNLQIADAEIEPLPESAEALYVPRTWVRARQQRRVLLAPPACTPAMGTWLRLMNAVDEAWPERGGPLRVPELRTTSAELGEQLRDAHELALWVATLDPYASRDALHTALGDEIAILHQERRLGGDSPLALVLSQKSGGPVDRAIGRSLRAARIVEDPTIALGIGTELRKVASQGYGILALEASTTGAGINELVAHVVAFSLLATTATPWPLPPGCRVLLISLDDYKHWFPVKRADLLVLALDPVNGGVHGATIEVKARRTDAQLAATDAVDQLRQTLNATRWAAYPDTAAHHSRLWLNRIAEAACAVARETNFRLTAEELDAIERFRRGEGTLEWAGIGLVFHPQFQPVQRDIQQPLNGDLVPISVHSVQLTEQLLRDAAGTDLASMRTVETDRAPLGGGRVRRRPERRAESEEPAPVADEPEAPVEIHAGQTDDGERAREAAREVGEPEAGRDGPGEQVAHADEAGGWPEEAPGHEEGGEPPPAGDRPVPSTFTAPILGWRDGEPVRWHAAGEGVELSNGHVEIWGTSGAGKTQFIKSLLAQLSSSRTTTFGIADFKNDYGGDWPADVDAAFVDLWHEGAPFNPLALELEGERAVRSAIIEMRDIVDVAAQAFMRMGPRQKSKLADNLAEAYRIGRAEGAWPTLKTLDGLLDDDLRHVVGDLTANDIFGGGEPLGAAIGKNLVFGLHEIPGNGLTTVLAAGFILSALQLRMQSLPPVTNTIRYVAVVDEAHRVSAFKAIDTMVREGRSQGLALMLATQQPGDLPEIVSTNAQTKICFRLPAGAANAAARRLDPSDSDLAEQIRTLDSGEAFVALGGRTPYMARMTQYYRDGNPLS